MPRSGKEDRRPDTGRVRSWRPGPASHQRSPLDLETKRCSLRAGPATSAFVNLSGQNGPMSRYGVAASVRRKLPPRVTGCQGGPYRSAHHHRGRGVQARSQSRKPDHGYRQAQRGGACSPSPPPGLGSRSSRSVPRRPGRSSRRCSSRPPRPGSPSGPSSSPGSMHRYGRQPACRGTCPGRSRSARAAPAGSGSVPGSGP